MSRVDLVTCFRVFSLMCKYGNDSAVFSQVFILQEWNKWYVEKIQEQHLVDVRFFF